MVTGLIDAVTRLYRCCLLKHFYPVLQPAIGVGNAFEGWSPRAEGVVYSVIVPLTAPPGHTFHLELDTTGKMPGKNFCIRVARACTCTGEQRGKKMLCFFHSPEGELKRNEDPSRLWNLCTGSYLDVEKTALLFKLLLEESWSCLPYYLHWRLRMVLSSFRSCKFRLYNDAESFRVEVLFGVQQGDSDIYVISQPTKALFTPSTTWQETYAVAEMKFFRHIARQAPQDSCHLKCLQLLTCALPARTFSTYTLKTVMMHLLNTIPMSQWCRRDFLHRLLDSLDYLRRSLQRKRLDCFVIGNPSIPVEINLPPDFPTVEPPNLFWHLTQDPYAHRKAMKEYFCLQNQ
ncbi:IPIL1 protein, partial [Onychorhynchus coronatus]|nr:IPIL1 protein [Onychorhynchus coronatus]